MRCGVGMDKVDVGLFELVIGNAHDGAWACSGDEKKQCDMSVDGHLAWRSLYGVR